MGDEWAHLLRDAIALIAHHDDTLRFQLLLVDVLTVEQRAVDGQLGLAEQFHQIAIDHLDMCYAPHRGLYHLRVVAVDRIL